MRLLTLCLLLCSFALFAQDQAGIQFEQKAFDDLLAQAKTEDKLIFVDAYTTWCGPCKMMSAKIFPREDVGNVYNARFINAKIDMEKGEGPALARRYSVMAYPTYLFVNGDGELVHKGLGYIPADELLQLADVASSDKNLLTQSKRYEKGDRDPEFLASYAQTLTDVYEKDKADKVVGEYLSTKKDWADAGTRKMIISNPGPVGGERFNYMLEHRDEFAALSSDFEFYGNIQNTMINKYLMDNGTRKLVKPSEIKSFYEENAGAAAERLFRNYQLIYLERADPAEYVKAAVAYYEDYPSNHPMELNGLAWAFFESVDDPAMLEKALGWAKKSVALEKGYANMDTLAWLYDKLGRHEEAKETAREAIAIAKENGEDYSSTSPILEN